ncbi:16S rRNA (cytidine(1402)-2'-O)-methyltransferase [bacterium]|nr:16S rRNA (cytidine(1402)-2'-O)-methyltransferase [bacterium]NIN91532.1 16S rRNA (cytidine(1402)-2'-O)-methyltransferase [bacterium]NIO17937.1 16S rRNA (cytidine(1402)-2'-O)-methyltransferase [bacterium]NIO72918.1 16S rRNA (cytidine(1402)-2'-O)-methyltransferase [bacterium]
MGILYAVATPIGNLEDITLRALRILKEVDLIAAEDTRKTRKLLSYYDIHTPLTSYYGREKKADYLIDALNRGKNIAIVSEAGTPGISDPGYPLIKKAVEKGINVQSIPGPCAAVCALVVSGLPTDGFIFAGFLPRKKGKLTKRLKELFNLEKTVILYESPNRIVATLEMVKENFGEVNVVIARELTKKFEEVIRGSIDRVLTLLKGSEIKGEVIILLHK